MLDQNEALAPLAATTANDACVLLATALQVSVRTRTRTERSEVMDSAVLLAYPGLCLSV